MELLNSICDHKPTIYLPKMAIFNTDIPILIHFFTFSPFKLHRSAQQGSAASNLKPDVSQWKATLCKDVRLTTVYRRIPCRKFVTLSNHMSRYIRNCIIIINSCLLTFYRPCLATRWNSDHKPQTANSSRHDCVVVKHVEVNMGSVTRDYESCRKCNNSSKTLHWLCKNIIA